MTTVSTQQEGGETRRQAARCMIHTGVPTLRAVSGPRPQQQASAQASLAAVLRVLHGAPPRTAIDICLTNKLWMVGLVAR